jgi:PAS domain S-box-containing protein
MNRTKSNGLPVSRIALLGGGSAAADLLQTILHLCPTGERLNVVAVCGADYNSPALELARTHGVPHVGRSAGDVLGHSDIDVIVDLRDVAVPGAGIEDVLPHGVQVLGHQGVGMLLNMLELTRASEAAHNADLHELQNTQAHLDQFMDFAPFSVYMKDLDLKYKVMNQTALDLLGVQHEEVIGKSDYDLLPAAVARRIHARESQVLKDGKPAFFDGVLPLPNGERMYFSATIFPVLRNGRPLAVFGLLENITELHDSERSLVRERGELKETREELRGILENSQDIIFTARPNGQLISCNTSAAEVFGSDMSKVLSSKVHQIAVDEVSFAALFSTALSDGHASQYEMKFHRRQGGELIANVSLTRVNDPQGRPSEVVCIARNITERLQLQEDLIQTERLAAIGKMAAGVAHEINNPLTIIEALAGVMEDLLDDVSADSPDADIHQSLAESITKIYHHTARCTSITHNLLGFARRSTGARDNVSVIDILDRSLELLRPEANRLSLRVLRHYASSVPPVHTDPQLLEQIFVNLLKNAMDAIEERHPSQAVINLSVSLLEDPGDDSMRVAATIQDNGIGIPDSHLGQVFDLFYTSKPAGKGTGLGLSIVHNILRKIGGDIRVESEADEGSSFTVLLPIQLSMMEED